jgi:hypothetical protein
MTTAIASGNAPVASGWLRVAPNPVGAGAVIAWSHDAASSTAPSTVSRLRLYDPLGRLVRALDVPARAAGIQHVDWEALIGERAVPAGVYFLESTAAAGGSGSLATRVVVTH